MVKAEYFEVEGGRRLEGTLVPQGAKNEALQIIAATLLTDQTITISNLPDILDVRRQIELVEILGVQVKRIQANTFEFCAANVNPEKIRSADALRLFRLIRGSVLLVGPLLARFGQAVLAVPGGDKIGRRRLDTHFLGLQTLGADFQFENDYYTVNVPNQLKGKYILLDEASVTGTANVIMAAALAEGTTTIYNAACEPYIQQLCNMLNRMGTQISGIGSNLLTIQGVKDLKGTSHRLLSDMIEIGSFICLAAMTQSNIRITDANVNYLGVMPLIFQRMGVHLQYKGDDIIIDVSDVCEIDTFIDGSILTIYDHTWPGLSPDLLSVLLVLATQCKGTVLIHQKMFESRLFFVDKLIDMGAQIILCDPHRATVIGLGNRYKLRGISMTSPDIRAGVALLLAALCAQGKSKIFNIEQIDRGYQQIDQRLNALGADIRRLEL